MCMVVTEISSQQIQILNYQILFQSTPRTYAVLIEIQWCSAPIMYAWYIQLHIKLKYSADGDDFNRRRHAAVYARLCVE